MQKYETTIVIDSLQKSEEMQATTTKVENFIANHGGTILNKEDWGKKRLAYEINRKQYGNYYHYLFEGPGTLPGLLEREYRLEEGILRYLTVKADAKAPSGDETEEKETTAATEAPAPQERQASEAPPEAANTEEEKPPIATETEVDDSTESPEKTEE